MNKNKYTVTWMGESSDSDATVEMELTENEKNIIMNFFNIMAEHVPEFAMPSVFFNHERCGGQ